jgi:tripartite-type tricarboxylate transporter receptor subunit TctC
MKKLLLAVFLFVLIGLCRAEPLIFIVSQGAGSSLDVLARKTAQLMTERYGQDVVVENAPGGDQMVGFSKMSNLKGPSILFHGTTLSVFNPVIKNLSVPNLMPVAEVGIGSLVYFTNTKSGIHNVTELVDAIKRNQRLNFLGDALSVRISAISMIQYYKASNVQMIPYKSTPQIALDVASGQAELGIANMNPALLGLIHDGKIVPLATGLDHDIVIDSKLLPSIRKYTPARQFDTSYFISQNRLYPVDAKTLNQLLTVFQSDEIKKNMTDLGQIYRYKNPDQLEKFTTDYRKKLSTMNLTE